MRQNTNPAAIWTMQLRLIVEADAAITDYAYRYGVSETDAANALLQIGGAVVKAASKCEVTNGLVTIAISAVDDTGRSILGRPGKA